MNKKLKTTFDNWMTDSEIKEHEDDSSMRGKKFLLESKSSKKTKQRQQKDIDKPTAPPTDCSLYSPIKALRLPMFFWMVIYENIY